MAKRLDINVHEVARRYAAGATCTDLAKELNIGVASVWRALKGAKAELRNRGTIAGSEKNPTRLKLDVDAIVRRYQQGEPAMAIANDLDIDVGTVLKRLRECGIDIRSEAGRYESIPLDDSEIQKYYIEGWALERIAEEFKVSAGLVWKHVKIIFAEEIALLEAELSRQCGICATPENPSGRLLSLDHNHTTGEFRGYLCIRCNFMVGRLEQEGSQLPSDFVELLNKATAYLLNPPARAVIARLHAKRSA